MTALAPGLAGLLLFAPAALAQRERWPEFRGPGCNGDAGAAAIPLHWSEERGVRWKRAIHDRGWSSPVIWDGQIWLTTATGDGHRLFALCLDLASGEIERDIQLFEVAEPQHCNPLNSHASPSPVIEAGRVYVHFGAYGTACLDTASGALVWARRDLSCQHLMGPGSSPLLWNDLLVLTLDGADRQYVVALDKRSGKTVWKVDRSTDFRGIIPDQRKAYSTPIVVRVGEREEIVSMGAQATYGYDPRSGEELWRVRHGGYSQAARPVAGLGMVFLPTGFDKARLWAVKLGARGDLGTDQRVWRYRRNIPKMSSPLLVGELLFLVDDHGIATCLDARRGKALWIQRLGGEFCASPIHARGRVYFFDREGRTTVIAAAKEFKILARNQLASGFMASPAVVAGALILRTKTHLYRIEKP